MKYKYQTENTCSKVIQFDLKDNIVKNVEFLGEGCPGNLQAITKLVEGLTTEEIEEKLGGITCGLRNTSCADQLARAVKNARESQKQETF